MSYADPIWTRLLTVSIAFKHGRSVPLLVAAKEVLVPRPTLFVGSSTEGFRIAQVIQLLLDQVCEVSLWSQGVFGLTQGTLESLVTKLPDFDFAVLVLTADDLNISRGMAKAAARDNVLFELGLFIGSLGRSRTFIVYNRVDPPDLPTDLAGVTAATFIPPERGNLEAALGAACTRIQHAIERLGTRKFPDSASFKAGINHAESTARNEWRHDHPREYVGPAWIRVLPSADMLGLMYTMTLRWGPYTKQVEFTPRQAIPTYFLHRKREPDLVTLYVNIEPPSIVTFGQGLPPDQRTVNIDEGWEQSSDQEASSVEAPTGHLTRPRGGRVNRSDTVTGVVSNLPPHSQALILVQTQHHYWPQAKLRLNQEGDFTSEAKFGRVGDRDSGKEFILLLVIAPPAAAASFQSSLEEDNGMSVLPPDVLVLDKVTVIRS